MASNNPLAYSPSQVRKAVVGGAGFVVTVLSTILAVNADLIPERLLPWVHVVIAVAFSYGIFRAPNTTDRPELHRDESVVG